LKPAFQQEVWWSEREKEEERERSIINTPLKPQSAILFFHGLSQEKVTESAILTQSEWACVIFATGYLCLTNYHPSHTHTMCRYPRANKDGSVTEHKCAVKTSAELRTSSVSLAPFPLPPHSLFQRLCLLMNPPVLILISQNKLCHQLQVLPFLSVTQALNLLLRSPAQTSMNFHAAPGCLKLVVWCGRLNSVTPAVRFVNLNDEAN